MFSEMRNGVLYSAIGKYSNVVIQFAVQMILSRILSPEEFGVIAVVNVFIIFFQMLADFGIGPAIIQNKDLTERDNENIYSFSVYLSLIISILFSFLAKPISIFYNDVNYINIILTMSITLFFSSLVMVPQNLLQKNKEFKMVNMYLVFANAMSGIFSIVFALAGFSYYSIIIGNTVRAIFLWIAYYSKIRTRYQYKFEFDSIKKIYLFSKNQFGFNFVNYFSRNADSLLVGKYMSESALGFYNKAYQLVLFPNTYLAAIITPVIQPILSEYQTDKKIIKETYLKITNIMAMIGIPLTVFLYFSSQQIILFLFGSQWGQSVPIFRILALSVWIQMIQASSGSFFQSGNRTDLLFKSGIYSTILNLIAIFLGVLSGNLNILAGNLVVSFTINFIQSNYLLLKIMCRGKVTEIFIPLVRPFFMGILQILLNLMIPINFENVFVNLLVRGLLFVGMFLISLIITGQYKLLKNIMLRKHGS